MIGVIGVGDMGLPMSGHLVAAGFDVVAYDVDDGRLASAESGGASRATSLADLGARVDIYIACLSTDQQMCSVAMGLVEHGRPGQLLVVAGTHSLEFIKRLAEMLDGTGIHLVDAPVVFGARGALEGSLLSLCGGAAADVERARPVIASYSGRGVEHVGPLGSGQITKACNNLLHWIHSVANFECLAIAKRYGLDVQRIREVLLQSPADNGTLRRWESSRFTWHEKDMDFVIELAQDGGLVLPLSGQTDQLIKTITPADVAALLNEDECTYLGQQISALSPANGGLG